MMMTDIVEMGSQVYYVGAKHPDLAFFDELFPTDNGTTYNAYLIRGEKFTALVDTVEEDYGDAYIERIQSILPLEEIDYLIVNHTEQDHSGSIGKLLERNPNITIYCSRQAENFLKQQYEQELSFHVVKDNETLDLGGKTLRFILAPFLHWPDTIFTWLEEDRMLFSCDVFGAHHCRNELYDDEVADHSLQFKYYFDTIMRPFKTHVRDALKKIEDLDIAMICPSHGPVWRQSVNLAIDSYAKWAAAPPQTEQKRVLMLVHSPHGNTRQMAAAIRLELEAQNIKVIEMPAITLDIPVFRNELERADALLIGTATINRDAGPPVWGALAYLSTVTPKARKAAVFGSYGWSGESVKLVEERLTGQKYKLMTPGIRFRFHPTKADLETCKEFAQTILQDL